MQVITRDRISCCGSGRRGDRLVNEKPVRSHGRRNNSPENSTSSVWVAQPPRNPILSASSRATGRWTSSMSQTPTTRSGNATG